MASSSNLKVGSKGQDVLQVQQFLKSIGLYNGNIDGIFGPQTDNAVRQFQQSQNIKVDGIVGPITSSKIQSYGTKQQVLNNPAVQDLIKNDPTVANTISNLDMTGDLSGDQMFDYVSKNMGQPFDPKMYQDAYNQFFNQSNAYYNERQTADKASVENALGLNQKDYNRYLSDSAAQFGQDKGNADVSAAQRGVLFSTSRKQDLTNLQNKYDSDAAAKRDLYAATATGRLLDYQDKWGTNAVNSLGAYMSAPGQTYNAFLTRNNVNPTGSSSFYNPNAYNLTGTMQAEKAKKAAINAANYLTNYSNKSSISGYKNQY